MGETGSDDAGDAVAGAGDVNGDGFDDLITGTYVDDSSGIRLGAAYLVLTPISGIALLSNADAKFIGEATGDFAGVSVSGADDANGDGFDDIVVGASNQDGRGADAGAAYLLLGGGY